MASSLVSIKTTITGASYVDLPAPIDYKMTSSTLVDSARNTKGIGVFSVVREGIRKIELMWNYLSVAQFSNIAKLFESPTGSFTFYVKYFDTVKGIFVDSETDLRDDGNPRMFYVGDRVTDTAKIKLDSNNQPIGYTNVKLSLIEV